MPLVKNSKQHAYSHFQSTSVQKLSFSLFAVALLCLLIADTGINTSEPWQEIGHIGLGMLTPSVLSLPELLTSLATTLAFALLGVTIAAIVGMFLAHLFQWRVIRVISAFIRSIHELFWALLFLQVFGLTTITGLLAIIIPYTGIFAKVYAETLEESDQTAYRSLPAETGRWSSHLYARLMMALPQLIHYTQYRLECGIRSSSVLGFIGLPTLGFHLESYFKQGYYSEAAGVLYLFIAVIALMRFWANKRLILPLLTLSIIWLPFKATVSSDLMLRFFTHDILPSPLRQLGLFSIDGWQQTFDWSISLWHEQAMIGSWNTLILTQIALVGSGITALLLYPLISPLFFSRKQRVVGHLFLVVLRSIPELILAFIILLITGPSMIPAIFALSWHNGAIIAHLIGRYTEVIKLRADSPRGGDLYAYEVTPRVYKPFLAFLFYRWEVILRESAILGILGVHTLGFFIDSAFEELRFDRALFLILITALLNILVDSISRTIRNKLHLSTSPNIQPRDR
ncbi:PhnE/PtxC family ABC transporter permease [Alkalimarinus sediminis]|uniref:ABC transporter permease n=1 Tax=Alkalimarinus sediminis TaxID=1632866 RepID=A0A9E8HG24_9ALTE|nr:ABC transporter permease [Alkalimarinus sediminis]UZW73995.1 ABC transporter permease [Alkalimarinus sediminis]